MTVLVSHAAAGQRLDQFLTSQIPDISRARVQQLLAEAKALVNGATAKPSLKLKGGEQITILGDPQPAPLRAMAEDIPLDIVYEDEDLAVVNKPAGMMVHAGAGATDDERNRGTLVNALLHHSRQLVRGWRRDAAGDRASSRQGNQRAHRRRQERRGASQAGEPVLRASGEEALRRPCPRLACERAWNHQRRHQPRRRAAHSHDHAPQRRPQPR